MDFKMEEILLIAKKLFYEQGYNNTSFSMIAKEISSSRSAIAFFFNSKFNLANEVYSKISRDRKNRIGGELYKRNSFDVFISTAVEHRVLLNSCREDEKVRRFICELNENSVGFELHDRLYYYILSEAKNLFTDIDTKTEQLLKLHNVTVRGAHLMLLVYYFRKGLDSEVDFDFFCEYYIKSAHLMYQMDEESSNEIVEKSKTIFEQLNIIYTPYFNFEITGN